MRLILEEAAALSGYYEDSINESTGITERNYYIEGVFSTPNLKNRNGRIYPMSIWEKSVAEYQDTIQKNTNEVFGEWQHPPRNTVDPMKAVIKMVELKIEDGMVKGKAKILNDNSPETNKLKALIKEGYKVGVSSRGVGEVRNGVVEKFKLITYDCVDLPSDWNANLTGVVEGYQIVDGIVQDKEYEINESGCIVDCSLKPLVESTDEYLLVSALGEILVDFNASKLCDLSMDDKEEALQQLVDYYNEYQDQISSVDESVDINEEFKKLTIKLNESI